MESGERVSEAGRKERRVTRKVEERNKDRQREKLSVNEKGKNVWAGLRIAKWV